MIEEEVIACDVCGDVGLEKFLAICSKCTDGAQHTYCMRDILHKVPDGWMCEECTMSECKKSKSLVNFESSSNSKLKYSYARKRQTGGSKCCKLDAVQRVRECQSDNLANTLTSNSQKQENGDTMRSLALDLNANPEDGSNIVEVHEVGEFDGTSSSCEKIFLDGKVATTESVVDLNIPMWPKGATPKECPSLSIENVGDKPINDVKGKMSMEENNNTDNVKLHGKLLMDEKSDVERLGSSKQLSFPFVPPISYKETLDQLDWQVVEALISLSKGVGKI
ncbi:uncharacterized protein LOC109810508 [Cajanus cajan]|nr:uncharacterized protein LOC109810508 [Cajanus cajan]XP_029129646.1 uncharacterized protein LOC109810508 [Cajanus cajan]